ncbi:MAG: hypothetical protein PHW77_09170, partial [Eubacteriales bacterium]|nr:hypothetical protein [Eubacteriales bacterium]
MKKRLVSFALVCMMLLSMLVLSSCRGDIVIDPIKAKIYTIYTICGEGTTEEAIREVELALNRLTFYQLGLCVKLIMVTEDEYDDLITDTLAECKAYDEEKKKKTSKTTTSADTSTSSESSAATSNTVFTGDDYIAMLERGEEYVLPTPRLDIFLVVGYDNYIDLVGNNLLSVLDEKLTSEAKLIKDYVFPSFLEAAKVTNSKGTRKIYGIPMNKGIGQYDYIVFDKEFLDKYSIDADTMANLEDLEYYLKIIAENETDIVPLGNVFDSPEIAYLFEEGFSVFIKNGATVNDTYTNKQVLDYFTLIARYRAMGYLQEADNDDRWAVKFIRGTFEDIEKLEATTGNEYDYTIHSYPVATNEDLLSSLFSISAYTISDELTDASELLTFIETNKDAANLLTHGIAGVNYELNENDQVVRLNNDYNMDVKHTGNSFLTYTLKGENPNKWQKLMEQNNDSLKTAKQSVSLGFAYYPVSIKNPNDKTILYYEPNYVNIIKQYSTQFYPDLINGTLLDVSLDDIMDYVTPIVTEALTGSITAGYTDTLNAKVLSEMSAKYAKGTTIYNTLETKALSMAIDTYNSTSNQNKIKKDVKAQLAANPENAGLTDAELDVLVAEICTPDYLLEQIKTIYADKIEEKKNKSIYDSQVFYTNKDYNEYLLGDDYKARLDEVLNSEEYLEEISNATGDNVFTSHFDLCLIEINTYLQSMIVDEVDEFFAGLNDALKAAYIEFQDEYLEDFGFDDETTRSVPDYRISITNVVNKALKGRTTMNSALTAELRNMVTAELGEDELPENISNTVKERFTDLWVQNVVIETFSFNADSNYECKTATPALRDIVNEYITISQVKAMYDDVLLASFEKAIGLIKTIEVDISAAVPEEEEEEGDESSETSDETSEE